MICFLICLCIKKEIYHLNRNIKSKDNKKVFFISKALDITLISVLMEFFILVYLINIIIKDEVKFCIIGEQKSIETNLNFKRI